MNTLALIALIMKGCHIFIAAGIGILAIMWLTELFYKMFYKGGKKGQENT